MNMGKPDLDVMRRVLHAHQWSDISDWVHALDDLANLNDDEIERLVRPSRAEREQVPSAKSPERR